MSIHQFLGERHTLELQELGVLFQAPIERKTHLPGAREYLWIFDGCFVAHHVRTGGSITLDYVQGVAMKVSSPVKPSLVVESGHIDDQGAASPPPPPQ